MADRSIAIVIKVQGQNQAKAAFESVANSQKLTEQATKHANAEMRKQEMHLKQLEIANAKLSHAQNGLTNSFIKGNLAARAISVGYMAIQNSMFYGIRAAIEFEATMKKIEVITEVSGEKLKSLETNIRTLALSSPKTANELANTALEIIKLGLTAEEAGKALGSIVALSTILGENAVFAGEAIVAIKNVFGFAADELDVVSGKLFTTLAQSALDLEMFSTAFSYAGSAASGAGVSFEDLSAAMGTLSNAGIKASTIGTQLRSIILQMSIEGSKASNILGGETVETIGLTEAIKRLRDAKLSVGQIYDAFGLRAISVVQSLTDNYDIYQKLNGEINKNISLADKQKEAMDTIKGSWDKLKASFVDVSISLKDSLEPLTQWLLGSGSKFLNFLKEASMSQEEWILNFKRLRRLQDDNKASWGSRLSPQQEEDFAKIVDITPNKRSPKEDAEVSLEKFNLEFENLKKNIEFAKAWGQPFDDLTTSVLNLALKTKPKFRDLSAEIKEFYNSLTKEGKKKKDDPMFGPGNAEGKKDWVTAVWKDEEEKTKKLKELAEAQIKLREATIETAMAFEEWRNIDLPFDAITIGANSANNAIDSLSQSMAEAVINWNFSWKSMGNVLKSVVAQMIGDMIALMIKTLILKAIMASTGGGAGGFGYLFGRAFAGSPAPMFGPGFARGYSGTVRQPTMFMAGESGNERVTVTPAAKTARTSGDGQGVTINIQGDVYGKEKFMEAVNKANEMIARRYV